MLSNVFVLFLILTTELCDLIYIDLYTKKKVILKH